MRLPGFITKREHDEIVAKRDERIANMVDCAAADARHLRRLKDRCVELFERVEAAEKRLAPFIAPRERNADGTFKSTRPVGEMGEGGNA